MNQQGYGGHASRFTDDRHDYGQSRGWDEPGYPGPGGQRDFDGFGQRSQQGREQDYREAYGGRPSGGYESRQRTGDQRQGYATDRRDNGGDAWRQWWDENQQRSQPQNYSGGARHDDRNMNQYAQQQRESYGRTQRGWNEQGAGEGMYPGSAGHDTQRYGGGFGRESDYGSTQYGRSGQQGSRSGGQESGEWSRDRGQHYGRGPKGYKRSDDRIKDEVNDQLMYSGHIDPSDIEVSVSEGVVTLSGTVENRRDKYEMEQLASNVLGVQDVVCQIRVKRADQSSSRGNAEQIESKGNTNDTNSRRGATSATR